MNSIRPLITITILIVVGAFLYVKINEGPKQLTPPAGESHMDHAPVNVPPLADNSTPATPPAGSAPLWSTEPPMAVMAGATTAPSADADTGAASGQSAPAVPPIPQMPEIAAQSQSSDPATASTTAPADLPTNIPTASYRDQPATAGQAVANTAPAPATPPAVAAAPPATPEQANDLDVATTNLQSPPLAAQRNPLQDSPSPSGDQYSAAETPTAAASVGLPLPSGQASFSTSWPAIKTALDQGELTRAHQLLSRWHHDPTLTPTDAELVDTLLSQLAGTVVYSTEHRLEPAYVVKPGDTLETVAAQYNVPWQLLGKINGIAAPDQLQPGQELKVVRGPFSAVVDLDRKQLTLMLADRYAGKFPVSVPSAAAVPEGQWTVNDKVVVPATGVAQSAYLPEPAANRALVLRGEQPAGATLTIGSGETPAGATAAAPAIRVAPQDAEEIADILSIGSRVVIQR